MPLGVDGASAGPPHVSHDGGVLPNLLFIEAARAILAIDLTGVDPGLSGEIDRAWRDSAVPEQDPDRVIVAIQHIGEGLERLSTAVSAAASDVLRDKDVVTFGAVAALSQGGVVVVLAPKAGSRPDNAVLTPASQIWSDGALVSIDSHGGVARYLSPITRLSGSGSTALGSTWSQEDAWIPQGARLQAIVIAQYSDEPGSVRLGLEESLTYLASHAKSLGTSRQPLRSLLRLLAGVGGATLVRYREQSELSHAVQNIQTEKSAPLSMRDRLSRGSCTVPRANAATRALRYRAGAADSVEFGSGRVVLTREANTVEGVAVLAGLDALCWQRADGTERSVLISEIVAHANDASLDQVVSAVERLEEQGLLADEPSWTVPEEVAWSESETGVVVLGMRTSDASPMLLAESASVVWLVLVRGPSVRQSQLLSEVAAVYGVEIDTIRGDVEDLLQILNERMLIAQL